MAAYVFLCDLGTEQECLDRKLFGTNPGDAHKLYYSRVEVGDTLFLYNLDLGTIRGPFTASTRCQNNIDSGAWKASRRKFPWQVRVDLGRCLTEPLSADELRHIIPLTATPAGLVPPREIEDDQESALIEALRQRNAD